MNTFQSPRGTRDILPADQPLWLKARKEAENIAQQLGFQPITTPTYEEAGLFSRAIGEGTDVQDKEIFLVRSKAAAEEQYALRPEGTAGIVRSYIEHGMQTWPQPVKLFTFVNNFRYDRPQKGRYREHVQFDLEYFGDTGPFADAWIILAGWLWYQRLGLTGVQLSLNSLGTLDERTQYIAALQDYLKPHLEKLSTDSQKRLEVNPLRILDSKDPNDQALVAAAPQLADFLGEDSRAHLTSVRGYLDTWEIPYEIDPLLVRGLDYYSHTTFEWKITGTTGQQNSLGGGGRYNGLVTQLGGQPTGAVGVGLGMDRVIEAMKDQGLDGALSLPVVDVYLVAADEAGKQALLSKIPEFIAHGVAVDCNFSKDSVGAQLKSAAKSGARYAAILGQQELESGSIVVKELATGSQTEIAFEDIVSHATQN